MFYGSQERSALVYDFGLLLHVFLVFSLFLLSYIPMAQRASESDCMPTAWQDMGYVLEPGCGV